MADNADEEEDTYTKALNKSGCKQAHFALLVSLEQMARAGQCWLLCCVGDVAACALFITSLIPPPPPMAHLVSYSAKDCYHEKHDWRQCKEFTQALSDCMKKSQQTSAASSAAPSNQ